MRSFTYMLIVIPKAGFTITKGEDFLKEFTAPDNAIGMYRKFCTNCGTNVYQGPKDAPFIGTFPTNYDFIEKYPAGNKMPAEFGRPGCHINMENSAIGTIPLTISLTHVCTHSFNSLT